MSYIEGGYSDEHPRANSHAKLSPEVRARLNFEKNLSQLYRDVIEKKKNQLKHPDKQFINVERALHELYDAIGQMPDLLGNPVSLHELAELIAAEFRKDGYDAIVRSDADQVVILVSKEPTNTPTQQKKSNIPYAKITWIRNK